MKDIGLLAFDVYNEVGKNELFVGGANDYSQSLRVRIANNKPQHQIKLTKTGGHHFSLVLKKGLLPESFDQKNITVSNWRQVKGEDILNKDKLKQLPAFNLEEVKKNNQLDLKMDKVATALEKLIKEKADKETDESQKKKEKKKVKKTTTQNKDNETANFSMEKVADYLQNAGEDVKLGFNILMDLIKIVEDEKFKEENQWIGELSTIRDLYIKSLTDLKNLTQEEGFLSQNAILREGFEQMSKVFKDFAELHKRTLRILTDLELLDLKLQKKNAEVSKDAYGIIKHQLVTDLKPFIENFFKVDQLLEPLKQINLSEFFNLEKVSLNETIMSQLERKLVVEDKEQTGEWIIKRVDNPKNEEEEELRFLCSNKKIDKISINPYGYLLIDLNITGSLKGQSESINVQLNYPQTEFLKNGKPIKSSPSEKKKFFSKAVLNLLNYGDTGLSIPIRLNVVQGRQLLNNGDYENQATIQLKNVGREPIFFEKKSRLEIRFDLQNESEVKFSALMDKDNLKELKVGVITLEAVSQDIMGAKDFQFKSEVPDSEIALNYYQLKPDNTNSIIVDGFNFGLIKKSKKRGTNYPGAYNGKVYIIRSVSKTKYDVFMVDDVTTLGSGDDVSPTRSARFLKTLEFSSDKTYVENNPEVILLNEGEYPTFKFIDVFCPGYRYTGMDGITLPKSKIKNPETAYYVEKTERSMILIHKDSLLFKTVKGLDGVYKVFKSEVMEIDSIKKYIIGSPPEYLETIRVKKVEIPEKKITDVRVEKLSDAQDITTALQLRKGTINANYFCEFVHNLQLFPNKSLVVKLRNLKTKLPAGVARVDLSIVNVPKFRDTVWVAEFDRVSYFTTPNSGIFNAGNDIENLIITSQNRIQLNAGEYLTQLSDGFTIKKDDKELLKVGEQKTTLKSGQYSLEIDDAQGLLLKNNDQEIFKVSDLNSLSRQILPVGSIMLWYGNQDKLPNGWAICNGYLHMPIKSKVKRLGMELIKNIIAKKKESPVLMLDGIIMEYPTTISYG